MTNNSLENYSIWPCSLYNKEICSLNLEAIEDTQEVFRIILYEKNNKQRKIILNFKELSESYQVHGDPDVIKERKIKVNNNSFPFFTVENSAYLKWLHQESYEVWKTDEWAHLVILLDDAVIDVCSWDLPIIKYEYVCDMKNE